MRGYVKIYYFAMLGKPITAILDRDSLSCEDFHSLGDLVKIIKPNCKLSINTCLAIGAIDYIEFLKTETLDLINLNTSEE